MINRQIDNQADTGCWFQVLGSSQLCLLWKGYSKAPQSKFEHSVLTSPGGSPRSHLDSLRRAFRVLIPAFQSTAVTSLPVPGENVSDCFLGLMSMCEIKRTGSFCLPLLPLPHLPSAVPRCQERSLCGLLGKVVTYRFTHLILARTQHPCDTQEIRSSWEFLTCVTCQLRTVSK